MPIRRLDSLDRHTEAGLALEDLRAMEPQTLLAKEEDLHRLDAVLCSLSRREQIAIQLRFSDGMSYGDIGERLGFSREKARQVVSHSLSVVRERIES